MNGLCWATAQNGRISRVTLKPPSAAHGGTTHHRPFVKNTRDWHYWFTVLEHAQPPDFVVCHNVIDSPARTLETKNVRALGDVVRFGDGLKRDHRDRSTQSLVVAVVNLDRDVANFKMLV